MRIKKFIIIVCALLGLQFCTNPRDGGEIFTIYLVRHAEKELSADNPKDPPLTPCGQQRAESLGSFLGEVNLDAIYSTDYIRTKSTAQPSASAKQLEVQLYDPGELTDFAKSLIDGKEDAFVVGHSNTTATLAGLLAGQELGSFDEHIYNRIYQVVIYKETGRLHLLQSAFNCQDL